MRHRLEEWMEKRGFSHGFGHGEGEGHHRPRGEHRGFSHGFGRGDEEGHHGRRGGRHWGRGQGFGRPFDHGELRLVVLALIAEKPSHGYEIIKEIEDRFGGSYSPSPGVVYPTLTLLEELGHATVEETGGKKRYTITADGRAYLAENRQAADRAMGRMGEMGAEAGMGQMLQLVRAVGNLKMALRLRQRSRPMTEEQLKKIVAAIDAAAAAIENS
jgi:DNA-binding PadR family transcriptional regulator